MKPPLFSCLTSRVANNGSLYGRFLFGPLPIDISLTVATVLRRSLLHSQATFTIVSAEIEGATHEYASLPGIQESVLEILLNLGEIVLTSTQRNLINPNFRSSIGTSPFFFASVKVSGPGIITAKDIHWPKGIFCVKPSSMICTLSSNETLTMRLKIACSLNKSKNKQPLYENEMSYALKSPMPDFSLNSLEQANSTDLKANKSQLPGPTLPYGHDNERQNTQSAKNFSISSQENKETFFTSKNEQNKFEFFKLQENPSTSTSVNSLETNTNTTTTSLLKSHFIRIQNKNLKKRISKTKEISNTNNTLLYQQTIEATQRLLTINTGSLESYSIRKKKEQIPIDFQKQTITNKKTIFHDNKSQSVRKHLNGIKFSSQATVTAVPDVRHSKVGHGVVVPFGQPGGQPFGQEEHEGFVVVPFGQPFGQPSGQSFGHNNKKENQENQENKSQSQDLAQNVTFRIFPGLSNDFKKSSKADPLLNPKHILPTLVSKNNKQQQKELTVRTFKHELLVSSSSYPVEKVNFLIERDDELAGYRHRIILEVWTNGSISPRQAIFESIGSIIKLIYNFREPLQNSFS